MLICAAGDIHGAMDRLYGDVAAFEASLGVRFDRVQRVIKSTNPGRVCATCLPGGEIGRAHV